MLISSPLIHWCPVSRLALSFKQLKIISAAWENQGVTEMENSKIGEEKIGEEGHEDGGR